MGVSLDLSHRKPRFSGNEPAPHDHPTTTFGTNLHELRNWNAKILRALAAHLPLHPYPCPGKQTSLLQES